MNPQQSYQKTKPKRTCTYSRGPLNSQLIKTLLCGLHLQSITPLLRSEVSGEIGKYHPFLSSRGLTIRTVQVKKRTNSY